MTAGKRFDICYELTPTFGQKVFIRFQVGSLIR
jgi:hypothetical protein